MKKSTLKQASLNDICLLVTDGTHDTPKTVSEGIPFIKAKEIVGGTIDFENCEYVTYEDHLKIIARSKPEKGDILFAHIGASLGEAACIKTDKEFSIKNVALFKPDPKKVNNRYLYYSVIAPKFQNEIKNARTGSAQPFVSLGILRNHRVEYQEDLETQRKIASILSAYDDMIENNTHRIKILKEMARMIYREWFVNFRFPGHEQVKMVDSPLGMIPEGWEAGQLSDIASIIPGYAFKSSDWTESGVPVIKIKNIQEDGTVNTDETDFVSECVITKKIEKFLLNHGDILIAMTGATAGKVGRLRSKISMGLNQRVAKIQARKPYEAFVWFSVSNESARKVLFGLADGAAQPNMSGSQIENIELCIPDEKILQQFNIASMPMLHEIDVLYLKNQNLRQTRDLLLPKLISGEVTVADVGINTESAL